MVDFKEVYDIMKKKYEAIFDCYYPTYGERGFTEKNLSALFVEAYKEKVPSAIAWYEAPLESVRKENGHNDNKHMDVVIFDDVNSAAIFIESKRVYDKKKELQSRNDLQRLRSEKNRSFLSKQYSKNINTNYCIILADIWTTVKQKIDRLERWESGIVYDGDGEYIFRDFKDYETPNKIIKDQYHLLGYIEKIELY
jgi:hypothetical protein